MPVWLISEQVIKVMKFILFYPALKACLPKALQQTGANLFTSHPLRPGK